MNPRRGGPLGAGDEVAGFVIQAVAGRGGMGVVYRARQRTPDRLVALKVIAPDLADDPAFRARFARESVIAAQIEHPNVIPVHVVGEDDGVLFIAMRFIAGTDLRTLIAQDGCLEPRRAASIVDQVAQALDAAHAHGLVHRDVKPANILVASTGGRDHIYLTDFGLSRHMEESHGVTGTGAFLGTIDYVAPEQARGERVDARTDVYSLGCVLFHALTGTVPFPEASDVAKLYAHGTQPAPSVRERKPDISAAFDPVLKRAMAKRPDERYSSAGDLGRAAVAAAEDGSLLSSEASVAVGDAAPPRDHVVRSPDRPQGSDATSPAKTARLVDAGRESLATTGNTVVRKREVDGPRSPTTGTGGRGGGNSKRLVYGRVAAAALGVAVIAAAALAIGGGHTPHSTQRSPSVVGSQHPTSVARAAIQTIRVGKQPQGIDLGYGGVWVVNVSEGTVSRLDANSGRITNRHIAVGADPRGIAVGEDGVWVSNHGDGTVSRIEPHSGKVIDGHIRVGNAPAGIAVGEGAVWVADGDGTVLRINPRSGRIVGRHIQVGRAPVGIAVGEGAVWVLSSAQRMLWRIDPHSDSVTSIALDAGFGYNTLAAGHGAVWATNHIRDTVWRIDPKSLRVTSSRILDPGAITAGPSGVWVANFGEDTVSRLDPNTGGLIGGALPAGRGPGGVALGEGNVWVADYRDDTVSQIRR